MLCGSHIKVWNLTNHMKKQSKKQQQNAKFISEKLKAEGLMSFVSFFSFHFDMWTAKNFAQAFCTELTLRMAKIWEAMNESCVTNAELPFR